MRFHHFCLATLFFSVASLSSEPVQVLKKGNDLILTGSNCRLLENQVEALSAWSQKIEAWHHTQATCRCKGTICQVDISQVAPKLVKKLQNLNPSYVGPNCWNAALVTGHLIPQLRYTKPEEMSFWMNSPLCRKLSSAEKPNPGDIIAIRSADGGEVHGFVYLTNDLSFSKNGASNSQPYSLQSPGDVFASYQVPGNCLNVSSVAAGCPNYANFYECKPLDEYLKERKFNPSHVLEETEIKICQEEAIVSDLALNGKHPSRTPALGPNRERIKSTITGTLQALDKLAEVEAGKKHSPDEIFLWKSLLVRIDSTMEQLADF